MEIGIQGRMSVEVTEELTAARVGSGLLPVYATPSMIALMENTACQSVAPYLEEGQGTVGTLMNVKHLAATPVGMTVRCETVRKGDHVRQTGELTFTPEFSARVDILGRVACASAAPAEESVAKPAPGPAIDLSEVEQQQKDFNVKR